MRLRTRLELPEVAISPYALRNLDTECVLLSEYIIEDRGLRRPWDWRDNFRTNLKVLPDKYGDLSAKHETLPPSIAMLVKRLTAAGVSPVYAKRCNGDESDFSFLFELAAAPNQALYMLRTVEWGQWIVPQVFADKLTKKAVRNLQRLDEQLNQIIETCHVPKHERLFVKWYDEKNSARFYTGPLPKPDIEALLLAMSSEHGIEFGVMSPTVTSTVPWRMLSCTIFDTRLDKLLGLGKAMRKQR